MKDEILDEDECVEPPRCVKVNPELGTVKECEVLRRQVTQLKLVGNVIEVKGRGVLLLGTGKSCASLFLTLLYEDVFLVADEYCYVIRHPTHRLRWEAKQEVFLPYETDELIATAADYPPTGRMGPSLGGYARAFKEQWSQLEQLFKIPPWEAPNPTAIGIQRNLLRNLRLRSDHIDSVAQRLTPAYKACTKIDYIFFLLPAPFTARRLEHLLKTDGLKQGDRAWTRYLPDTLFDPFSGEPWKNCLYQEPNPEGKVVLGTLMRLEDERGDDWRVLLPLPDVPFIVGFYYDNFLEKVQEIYRLITPLPRIHDHEEQFWREYCAQTGGKIDAQTEKTRAD